MREFDEVFEKYGGDYKTTLGRFMGNEKMYLKFLNMLFKDENLKKLGDAVQEGNLTAAFEAAHTLKGVTANLGLTPLYNEVCRIVEPLRKGEARGDYHEMYQTIWNEFRRAEELCHTLNELG